MAAFSTTALGPESPLFRGREPELARLLQLCLGEVVSYVVLYGGRQTGKTSLLLRLEARLRPAAAVARLDFQLLQGAAPSRAFAFLAEQIAQALPLAPSPAATADGPALRGLLSEALARPEPARFVLILDEWGALPADAREALANALRSLFDARLTLPALAKLQVVFSGGVELYDLVVAEASSLHSISEELYLADLAAPEAVGLIADGLRQIGAGAEESAALGAAVYARVAGHPYLTQRLGALLERAHRDGQQLGPTAVAAAARQVRQGDPLLRRISADLREHGLEDAARRLLSSPPPFTRLDDPMARLELIGLARPAGERWAPRNPLLAELFREQLGVPAPASATGPGTTPATPATTDAAASPLSSLVTPTLVKVPAGPFLMGSGAADRQAYSDERPQHRLELPDFWIGTTPITNAQLRPFVEGDGYSNSAYWTRAGWRWREQGGIDRPLLWDDARWRGDAYPAVGVSWHEAVAYARWLSAQTGRLFRLPSEAEWEKAARGPEGRIWPWGSTWEAGRCNSEEAGINRTTPAGLYPAGASVYGALDLAGNVWEWCATQYGKGYPYQLEDEWAEPYLEAAAPRRFRGGAWNSGQRAVRAAYRVNYFPHSRGDFLGLRIASSAP